MSRISNQKLQRCIAEEAQLLAEEKWIIKALSLIKKERNSLQIERLQLESVKLHAQGLTPKSNAPADEEPTTSVVNLMQNVNAFNGNEMFEDVTGAGVACNEEQLNLTVTNSVFDKVNDFNMEEDEDENDNDNDDVIIDMNMFMNGL